MVVRTASNQHLPVLGKTCMTFLHDHPTGLITKEVLHLPNLKEKSILFKGIEEDGLNFVVADGVLALANGRISPSPKCNLYACM